MEEMFIKKINIVEGNICLNLNIIIGFKICLKLN